MGKNTKQATSPAQPATTTNPPTTQAAPQPVQRYLVIAPKRPLTGTKHGGGTSTTHGLLAKAATDAGGTLTFAEAQRICKEAGDPGFARYALNRLKVLVPQSQA